MKRSGHVNCCDIVLHDLEDMPIACPGLRDLYPYVTELRWSARRSENDAKG